jgi:hypothetical protein
VRTDNSIISIIKIFLGAALVISLFAAGWSVYRRLPADGSQPESFDANANSVVTIVLRNDSAATSVNAQVEIYPLDYASAQRDFSAVLRPGKNFDDFLAQRIKGLLPVRPQLDASGRAVAKLSEGNWWIRATAALSEGEKIEWRLPIRVLGRAQTVELTAENAYERTKTF